MLKKKIIKLSILFFVFSALIFIFILISGFRIVRIEDYNDGYYLTTKHKKVIDIVNHNNINLSPADLLFPSQNALMPRLGGTIIISRANEVFKTVLVAVDQQIVEIPTAALPAGRQLIINPGAKGYREEIYKSVWIDGMKIKEELVDIKIICKDRKKIILKGASKKYMDFYNSEMYKNKHIKLRASAYSPAAESCAPFDDGFTAIGLRADYGIAAVDPKFIPLGALLYIEGYGYAIAGDVGSAIKHNYIDLCFENSKIAFEFGVKQINAFILD